MPSASRTHDGPSLRPLQSGDLGWIVRRHGMLYTQEYGWDITFEGFVAEIAGKFLQSRDPRWENAWVAVHGEEILGSVFLVRESDVIGKLRLLYVEPKARGLGVGKMLVDACIADARAKGYEQLTLWTNDILDAARGIYLARGFRLVAEERHHSFGADLVGQNWELDLGTRV